MFDGVFTASYNDFRKARSFDAPREEVRRAARYDHPFVFMISGTAHTDETLRQLEAKSLNYLVVVPRSNGMSDTVLKEFQEGPKGSALCAPWNKAHRVELDSTIGAFRDKFRRHAEEASDEVEGFVPPSEN